MKMNSSIKATFLYAISHFNHEYSLNVYFHIYIVAINCYSATYDPYQERKWTKLDLDFLIEFYMCQCCIYVPMLADIFRRN